VRVVNLCEQCCVSPQPPPQSSARLAETVPRGPGDWYQNEVQEWPKKDLLLYRHRGRPPKARNMGQMAHDARTNHLLSLLNRKQRQSFLHSRGSDSLVLASPTLYPRLVPSAMRFVGGDLTHPQFVHNGRLMRGGAIRAWRGWSANAVSRAFARPFGALFLMAGFFDFD
jgi:hypothetical protein